MDQRRKSFSFRDHENVVPQLSGKKYELLMPIDRDVLEAIRDMGEHELRRLLMLARARLEQRGVVFDASAPDVKLMQRAVRCGKSVCQTCPHGPYWYAYWWEDGKRRSRYVGKIDDLPEMVDVEGSKDSSRTTPPSLRSVSDG